MSNTRLLVAQGLAVVAVVLALLNDFGLSSSIGLELRTTGITAFILALAAFFIAVEKGSVLISALLIVQGLAGAYFAYSAGAMIGIYFGLLILALGIAKGGVTALRVFGGKNGLNATQNVSSGQNKAGV
ncbi:MAG: hypothetical protein JRN15_19590 [Nitrososphaerota archaeon]|nr:hypothetical protein [Nitrososphaerota archaeon]